MFFIEGLALFLSKQFDIPVIEPVSDNIFYCAKKAYAYMMMGANQPSDANTCPSATYEVGYNGDHASGETYICYESGTANEQATANTADSVTSDYVQYDAVDKYLEFTLTGDISAGLDSEGSLFFSVYIVTDVSDEQLIEIYSDTTDYITIYINSADDKIYGIHRSEDAGQNTVKGSLITADGWYRVGYTWQTGEDAAGKHNISIEAGDDKMDVWEENEDVEDLDDWDDEGTPLDPTYLAIGEHNIVGSAVSHTIRIKDVYITTGYEAADPLP